LADFENYLQISTLPTVLYSDTDSALISAVQKNYLKIRHLYCIFHINLNLKKKLKGKLCEQFEPFYIKFLVMCNSLCHKRFKIEWNALINKFLTCK